MKKLLKWAFLAMLLMIVSPMMALPLVENEVLAPLALWLWLILFVVINPVFSAVCGMVAGNDIKQLWILPMIVAGLSFISTLGVLKLGEGLCLLLSICYLVIGSFSMLLHFSVTRI